MKAARSSPGAPPLLTTYESVREDCYILLAALLGQEPSERLLAIVRNLHWDDRLPDREDEALEALRRAGRDYSLSAIREEFRRLFVGLGCGEVVPYASWYREKKIQASALASLRADLTRLGIVRQAGSHESEDHAGALCEIMALVTRNLEVSREEQAAFFERHIASWMEAFFRDLISRDHTGFYGAVGIFGARFLQREMEYLRNRLGGHTTTEGGVQDET